MNIFNIIILIVVSIMSVVQTQMNFNNLQSQRKFLAYNRLNMVIDNSSDAALNSATLQLTAELQNTDLDPNEIFNEFLQNVAYSYNMGEVKESTNTYYKLNHLFPFMVLLTNDGFYIRYLRSTQYDKVEQPANTTTPIPTNKNEYQPYITPKLPYTYITGEEPNVTAYKYAFSGDVIKIDAQYINKDTISSDDIEKSYIVDHIDYDSKRYEKEVLPRIAESVTKRVKAFIKDLNTNADMQIILPQEYELQSKIFPISGLSLITFTKNFDLESEPISVFNIAGTQIVRQHKVYCYQEDGKKYYYFENSKNPVDPKQVEKVVNSAEEAVELGYSPALHRILSERNK